MQMDEFIIKLGYSFLTLNTLLFIISYKSKYKELKYFIMYLVICTIVQKLSSDLSANGDNNLYLTHFFFIGQFLFLSLFFSKILELKKWKKFVLFSTFVFSISFIIYFYFNQKAYNEWNELEIALTSIPLIIYSFLFFLKKIDTIDNKKYIYFNSGFFVYTLCSTLIFLLGNIGTRSLKLYVWDINQVLYLLFQIAIFIEWYKNFRKLNIFCYIKNKIKP
tara:strand:- start:221 stop:880 length:660 start_codon:yes stop_codon:yes gene_type:complete